GKRRHPPAGTTSLGRTRHFSICFPAILLRIVMNDRSSVWVVLAMLPLAVGVRADEAAAVAELEKLGANITRNEKQPVIGVVLARTKVTDAGLKHLKELKHLTRLDLSSTNVTDKGLKELRELKNL